MTSSMTFSVTDMKKTLLSAIKNRSKGMEGVTEKDITIQVTTSSSSGLSNLETLVFTINMEKSCK